MSQEEASDESFVNNKEIQSILSRQGTLPWYLSIVRSMVPLRQSVYFSFASSWPHHWFKVGLLRLSII